MTDTVGLHDSMVNRAACIYGVIVLRRATADTFRATTPASNAATKLRIKAAPGDSGHRLTITSPCTIVADCATNQ